MNVTAEDIRSAINTATAEIENEIRDEVQESHVQADNALICDEFEDRAVTGAEDLAVDNSVAEIETTSPKPEIIEYTISMAVYSRLDITVYAPKNATQEELRTLADREFLICDTTEMEIIDATPVNASDAEGNLLFDFD